MNRQEALNKLQEYYDWNYDVEEYSEEYEKEQKQNLEDIIKYLKQPITLADFLGWEEGVEYKNWGSRYKIIDNELYLFSDKTSEWKMSEYNSDFASFKQAEKIQPKNTILN